MKSKLGKGFNQNQSKLGKGYQTLKFMGPDHHKLQGLYTL